LESRFYHKNWSKMAYTEWYCWIVVAHVQEILMIKLRINWDISWVTLYVLIKLSTSKDWMKLQHRLFSGQKLESTLV